MLSESQVKSFPDRGFLHLSAVFTRRETDELADHVDQLIRTWGFSDKWTGPWRQAYLDPEVEKESTDGPRTASPARRRLPLQR